MVSGCLVFPYVARRVTIAIAPTLRLLACCRCLYKFEANLVFKNRLCVCDFRLQIWEILKNSQSSFWASLPNSQFYMYMGAAVGVIGQFSIRVRALSTLFSQISKYRERENHCVINNSQSSCLGQHANTWFENLGYCGIRAKAIQKRCKSSGWAVQ